MVLFYPPSYQSSGFNSSSVSGFLDLTREFATASHQYLTGSLSVYPEPSEGCSNSVSNLCDETLINRSDTDLYKDEVLPSIKDCDGGLYVGQEEWAVTYPNDPAGVRIMGTVDATTCHAVIIRDPLSGATGITHAGYCNENVLNALCEKVCQLSGVRPPCHTAQFVPNHQPPSNRQGVGGGGGLNHHLDLYIIGGYEDEQGHSQRLSMHLLSFLQRLPYPLDLRVCCIGKHNTKMARVSGRTDPPHTAPIAYSAAIDIQTGRVFRCTFANKPDNIIRHMRLTFNPIDEDDCDSQNIYDSDKGIICIKAFTLDKRRARVEFLEGWINVPDSYFLERQSTSPKVEPPYFVRDCKAAYQLALSHVRDWPDSNMNGPTIDNRMWRMDKGRWCLI